MVQYEMPTGMTVEQDTETNSELIVLLDIGTHDEVY